MRGKLPLLSIPRTVTAFGREMITLTKTTIESIDWRTKLAPGEDPQGGLTGKAEVIYGDTDSVMVKFIGCTSIKQAIYLIKIAAEIMNAQFIRPICLMFEKVLDPYLLISKKRYIGLLWENPDHYKEIKVILHMNESNC